MKKALLILSGLALVFCDYHGAWASTIHERRISEPTSGCTRDVHKCKDGTRVERDPNNNCEFFPCPNPCPKDDVNCNTSTKKANGQGGNKVKNKKASQPPLSKIMMNKTKGSDVEEDDMSDIIGTHAEHTLPPPTEVFKRVAVDDSESDDSESDDSNSDDSNSDDFKSDDVAVCGDGEKQPEEACDGSDLGGMNCTDLGYSGGHLQCTDQCSFSTIACTTCGDGIREYGESCDSMDLDEFDCTNFGFIGGTLSCDDMCEFDLTMCHACGDGEVNGDEDCDLFDLNEQTCRDFGFAAGSLACNDSCEFDTSGCATAVPSAMPSASPTKLPSSSPSANPTNMPSHKPSTSPSNTPSTTPSMAPSKTDEPSQRPSSSPSFKPSTTPSVRPTFEPSPAPSATPSYRPSLRPTTMAPTTSVPSSEPSTAPTQSPSLAPTTSAPTINLEVLNTMIMTNAPTSKMIITEAPTSMIMTQAPTSMTTTTARPTSSPSARATVSSRATVTEKRQRERQVNLWSEDFETDEIQPLFHRNLFRKTRASSNQMEGEHSTTRYGRWKHQVPTGGLRLRLFDAVGGTGSVSAGWTVAVQVDEPILEAIVEFQYRVDSTEWGSNHAEIIVAMDNADTGGEEIVVESLDGNSTHIILVEDLDGNAKTDQINIWKVASVHMGTLMPGLHTIRIGGYLSYSNLKGNKTHQFQSRFDHFALNEIETY